MPAAVRGQRPFPGMRRRERQPGRARPTRRAARKIARCRQADAGRRPRPGPARPPGYPAGSLLGTAPGPAPPLRTGASSDRAPLAPVPRPRPSRPRRHPGAPHGSAPWRPRRAPRTPRRPGGFRLPGDQPATRLDRPVPPEYLARPVLLVPVNCLARVRRYAPVRRAGHQQSPGRQESSASREPSRARWPTAAMPALRTGNPRRISRWPAGMSESADAVEQP